MGYRLGLQIGSYLSDASYSEQGMGTAAVIAFWVLDSKVVLQHLELCEGPGLRVAGHCHASEDDPSLPAIRQTAETRSLNSKHL